MHATGTSRRAPWPGWVEFIRDANNAADFLTKWVPAAKLKASIAYTSNEAAKPKKQAKTEISTLEVSMIEQGGTSMLLRSGTRKYPHPPPSVAVPQPMLSPAAPIAALPASEAPEPQPEQPATLAASMPPALTTLADPKHFAARLFEDGLPGPSGSHGAYFKGRPRSFEPYDDDELYGSDAQNSDAHSYGD